MITSFPEAITNPSQPLSARLNAALALTQAPSPRGDTLCVALLDLWPPHTTLGQLYRELLVTEGGSVPALAILLWEPPGALRRAAARRLGELADPTALPDLLGLLGHQLAGLQPRDSALVLVLLESALCCWLPGEISVPLAVAGALSDPDAGVRRVAAALLRRMGTDASIAAAAVLTLLAEPDPRLRLEAVELLPAICPPDLWRAPLRARLECEPDPLLQSLLQDALALHSPADLAA